MAARFSLLFISDKNRFPGLSHRSMNAGVTCARERAAVLSGDVKGRGMAAVLRELGGRKERGVCVVPGR